MPDGMNTSSGMQQMAQRGIRGGFPRGGPRGGGPRRGFPRGGFPRRRFPRRIPVRQRFPRFFFFPINYGFPTGRCYWVDQLGRCCDRYGRCCDRYGRCFYANGYDDNRYEGAVPAMSGWYGVPGSWDMMPDYDDMTDYDMNDMDDMRDMDDMDDMYDRDNE